MIDIPEKIKRRLFKLLALSNKGVGGEQVNAESRLDALLKKHGINKEDFIETEDINEFYFSFVSKFEKRLFIQIIVSVEAKASYSYKGSKRLSVECTPAQHAEIKLKYSIYRKALQDELELTFVAFVNRQNIFAPSANLGIDEEEKEYTQEEIKRHELIDRRARTMSHVKINAGIEKK